jgi:hypothetical protein
MVSVARRVQVAALENFTTGVYMLTNGRRNWSCVRVAGAIAALAIAGSGCSDDNSDYYYDPYGYYDYYYPSSYAYVDPYYMYGYPGVYYQNVGSTTDAGSDLPALALRSLALGESVCPGQVTLTAERIPAPCGSGEGDTIPASTSIQLNGCELSGGGKLDGALKITATQTPSDTKCDAGTSIAVSYTSTTTNLVYTAPSGARVELPEVTRTGSFTRKLDTPPAVLTINSQGRIERYDEQGAALSKTTFSGSQTLTLSGANGGFHVDGALTLEDAVAARTASVTSTDLSRAEGCCYPTSGSVAVVHADGTDTKWSFGPNCGDVMVNDHKVKTDECF